MNCRALITVHMSQRFSTREPCANVFSMIVGTGIDIAEVPRIREAIERHGQRFLNRIFTEGEIQYCESKANRVERYAARFAAKEAGMKAIGTGWNHGVRWRDIEVARKPGGRPTLVAARKGRRICRQAGSHQHRAVLHPHGGAGHGAGHPGKLHSFC